jgi:hypothetical protein
MNKICVQCSVTFEVSDEDRAFLEKVSPVIAGQKYLIPEPDQCPDCRKQRRMCFRNDRSLYKRKCDLSGRDILSICSVDKPFTVYGHKEWWSDQWNALDYGREFDFSRSFFEQWRELQLVVPRLSLNIDSMSENSDYANQTATAKNCYMVSAGCDIEDCLYCFRAIRDKCCVDCLFAIDSELCYECIDVVLSYNCRFSQNISNCRDSAFLFDCQNCNHCMFSVNLRNKSYCIYNQQYSREDYFEKLKEFQLSSRFVVNQLKSQFEEYVLKFPHRFAYLKQCESVTGDNVISAKECREVYDGTNIENVYYSHFVSDTNDSMDVNFGADRTELNYDVISTGLSAYRILMSIDTWPNVSDLIYCDACSNGTRDCFGCVGLRGKQYCILNRQYSRVEYEELVGRIINRMVEDGEYGLFFPAEISPYGYNESLAYEFFPLSKEEALEKGFNWYDEEERVYKEQGCVLPDLIDDVQDDLLKEVLQCDGCGKNYRLITKELAFYRQVGVPVPVKCFGCRHKERFAKRNPAKLWGISCGRCGKRVQSTYSPNRREIVYCDECFLTEVY